MAIFIPRWEKYKDKKPSGPVDINWNNGLSANLVVATSDFKNELVKILCGCMCEWTRRSRNRTPLYHLLQSVTYVQNERVSYIMNPFSKPCF